jgi:uncharacterized protein (TIGR02145 family)
MKYRTGFFQASLLAMACLVSCSDQDLPVMQHLISTLSVVFPEVSQPDETHQDSIADNITYNFIHASTVSAYLNPELTYDSIADIEGNTYATIKIGDQVWMAENLKTTRYNDSTEIPYVIDNGVWVSLKTGAYRWYKNNEFKYKSLYGALYNWYTVKTGKLCPAGYHVPSDEDWIQLELALGMTTEQAYSFGEFPGIDGRGTDQAIQMKSVDGWMQWEEKGGGGTNTSGFTSLPAGECNWDGSHYYGEGICTTWWDSTSEGGGRAVDCVEPGVARGVYYANYGISVRCVKN